MVKLKLTTKPLATPDGAPGAASPATEAPAPTPTAGPKIKFKIGSASAADSQATEPPKQKRKYTKKPKFDENGNPVTAAPKAKKRARDETGDDGSPPLKRKPKPTAKSLALLPSDDDEDELAAAPATVAVVPRAAPVRSGSMLKLKMRSKGQPGPQRSNTTLIKIKGVHGKPPVRPPGVGYDSEAEEAEDDPAIESQFVLRMQPGPDCDLLRKAIEEKQIGKPSGQGGIGVQFRFFDREGRRALVTIQGRFYAACMVDLPCIIESMKSWNKRDWVKTADVCQMLLVLGRVQSEDEAKKHPLPREVDPSRHLYAHGLTPPMHYVRTRRFRKRKSYHQIEKTEAAVNALLEADERAKQSGGGSEWTVYNPDDEKDKDKEDNTDEEFEMDEDEDEEGVVETTEGYVIEGETPGGEMVEVDADEFAAQLEAEFMVADDDTDGLFGSLEDNMGGVETPTTAHDVAIHALGDNAVPITESPVASPNTVTSPDDDDDDDDADAESQEDVVDAEAAAAQDEREEIMSDIRNLESEIAEAWANHNKTANLAYRRKVKQKIDQLTTDLNIKKELLGIDEDDDH